MCLLNVYKKKRIMDNDNNTTWNIIECHFRDNPQSLVKHHIESYNHFMKKDIYKIFKEMDPICIISKYDDKTGLPKTKCNLYLGGKTGEHVHIVCGKSLPNEARLKNETYAAEIYIDIEVELVMVFDKNEVPIDYERKQGDDDLIDDSTILFKNPKLDKDLLKEETELSKEDKLKQNGVEEQNGGEPVVNKKITVSESREIEQRFKDSLDEASGAQTYTFVLKKIFIGHLPIMVQSDFCALNKMPKEMRFNLGECKNDLGGYFIVDGKEKTIVPKMEPANNVLCFCDNEVSINSVSENYSKSSSNIIIKQCQDKKTFAVCIPQIEKPVPLFILLRALGLVSDKEIMETCLLDLHKYEDKLDYFINSLYEAAHICTQVEALQYIANLCEGVTTIPFVQMVLSQHLFPHIGEGKERQKALFLGYMARQLVCLHLCTITKAGTSVPDKPCETPSLSAGMSEQGGADCAVQMRNGVKEKYATPLFKDQRVCLVGTCFKNLLKNYHDALCDHVTEAFENILKEETAAYESRLDLLVQNNYKEVFSKMKSVDDDFEQLLSCDLDRTSFLATKSQLRKIDCTECQFGLIDFIDSEQLPIMAHITATNNCRDDFVKWMCENVHMQLLDNCTYQMLSVMTKVFVNGYWAGAVDNPMGVVNKIKLHRRNGLIPVYTSVNFDVHQNVIFVFVDAGRICRPLYFREKEMSNVRLENELKKHKYSWQDLVSGFNKRKEVVNEGMFYKLGELYEVSPEEDSRAKRFHDKKALLDYVDKNEEETIVLGSTHAEIHESLTLGLLSNLAAFVHHCPATTTHTSLKAMKCAASLYSTNYGMRMDAGTVLNQGQKPLVKTRYSDLVGCDENCGGENVIIAIASCEGMIVNEGSVKRGLFRTTIFTEEEDEDKELTKKQHVHQTFNGISRIREQTMPTTGDILSSRCGIKGSIAFVVPESDMPFTKNGVRPDIIIDPLAIMSESAVGQLLEILVGKACLANGFHGDCTAFATNGNQINDFARLLVESRVHSSGNEILYDGITGEQLLAEVFIGTSYYMYVKRNETIMVGESAKDGLTRQSVDGFDFGEEERDCMVAYGAADFLKETWNDNYFVAVCNKTGGIAVYNPDKNLFISPLADGPIRFIDSLDGKHMNIERVTHFGRTFSIIRVPYAFKLLMQELQSINVKMRIVTEDNIDQFECMQFSKTVKLRLDEELLVKESEKKELMVKESEEKESLKESEEKESEEKESLNENKESEVKKSLQESLKERPVDEMSINEDYFKPDQESIQHTETKTYNVGDAVHFKGDFKHSRVWLIEEFDKGFAILKTEDVEGLENSRKVVPLDDIVHVIQETLLAPPQTGGDVNELPKGFAPVFNIVTGNDNKIETPTRDMSPKKGGGVSFDDNSGKEDTLFGGTSSVDKETDFNKPLIKSDKQLMSGGAIVIKKLS